MAGRREMTSRESRRMLIAAAAEVIGERGYRQATFAEIADRAGISRGSIPWHFRNKEGLLEAVVEQVTEDMQDRFGASPSAAAPDLDEAIDTAVEYLQLPQSRMLTTVVAEAIEDGSPLQPRYKDLHALMRGWIRQWVSADQLPPGVSEDGWSTTVLGAIMGIHQQWRIAPDEVDLDQAAAALRAMAHAVLTGGGAPVEESAHQSS